MPTLKITDPTTGETKTVHLSGDGNVTQADMDEAEAIAFPKSSASAPASPAPAHHSATQPRNDGGQFNGPPAAFPPASGSSSKIAPVFDFPGMQAAPGGGFTTPDGSVSVREVPVSSSVPLNGQTTPTPPLDPASLLMPQGNDTPPIAPQDTSAPIPDHAREPSFLDRMKSFLNPSDELARSQEAQTHEAFLPPVSTENTVAAYGTQAIKNFTQGATAPGLARMNSGDGSPLSVARDVFTDIPGNVRSGWDAMTQNDGDQRIGAEVPELASSTGAGMAYNAGVAAGTDPLNLATMGASEVGSLPVSQILGMLTKRLFPGAQTPAPVVGRNPFAVPSVAPVAAVPPEFTAAGRGTGLNAADPLSVGAGNVPGYAPSAPAAPLSGQSIAPTVPTSAPPSTVFQRTTPEPIAPPVSSVAGSDFDVQMAKHQAAAAPKVFRRSTPEPGESLPASPASISSSEATDFSDLSAKPYAPSPSVASAGSAGSAPPLESFANTVAAPRVSRVAPDVRKIGRLAVDLWNLPRSLKVLGDASAPIRQAGVLGAGHPINAGRAALDAFRALGSEAGYEQVAARIARSPYAAEQSASGLYLSTKYGGPNAAISQREESFLSGLVGKIPGVSANDRAYRVYLDSLRASTFDQGVETLRQSVARGAMNPAEYEAGVKAYGHYINAATGRGHLGIAEKSANVLAQVGFSPRAFAGRLEVFGNPAMYARLPRPLRLQAARDLVSYVGAGYGFMRMAEAAGAKADYDMHSHYFGTVQYPGSSTHVDVWAGYGSLARFVIAEASGKRRTSYGNMKKLDGSGKYPETRLSVARQFAESNLHPSAAAVVDTLRRGKDTFGDDQTPVNRGAKLIAPIVAQSIHDLIKAEGVKGALPYIPGAVAGVGMKVPHEDTSWSPDVEEAFHALLKHAPSGGKK